MQDNFLQLKRPKMATRALRAVLLVGVITFLLYRLTQIGWAEVWNALPESPLFYLILLVMYVLYPVAEGFIYHRVWHVRLRTCLPVSFRKRVLNQDLLSYSGEVYFYNWAKKHVAKADRVLLTTIKDNLIITSIVSIGTAVVILGVCLFSVPPHFFDSFQQRHLWYGAGGFLLVVLAVGAAVRFRRTILSVPVDAAALMLGTHLARFSAGRLLQILQWWVVVPEASLVTWIILLSVMVLTQRIPFVPSSDLVFVSLGTHVAAFLDVSVAVVAGMLLARSVSEKILNAGIFCTSALWERLHASASLREDAEGAASS